MCISERQSGKSCNKKTVIQKDTHTLIFTAELFTIARTWKQPKCPLQIWHMSTTEYYSAIKKNEIMPFAGTWKDLEIIILSEVSQTEKDKYGMITRVWNLSYDTKEYVNRTETDSQTWGQTSGLPGARRAEGKY